MEKLALAIFVFLSSLTYAHQGEEHGLNKKESKVASESVLSQINKKYQKEIAPIFENKCMDCHGQPKNLPWYHVLPIAKGIMNSDMKEAKKHLDMRGGFPFKGHGTPSEDLLAISDVIEKKEMPPLRYKILNWNSRIDNYEKEKISRWVEESKSLIQESKK